MPPPSVRYHRQDTSDFCGPATQMMILRHLESTAVSPVYALGQAGLHGLTPVRLNWSTRPDDMATVLSSKAPTKGFALQTDTVDADTAAEALAQAFSHDASVPAAILWNGCSHWAVVCGVATTVSGGTYSVNQFYLNIPMQIAPAAHAPTHADNDTCGNNLSWPANTQFTYLAWKCQYVLPCKDYFSRVAVVCGTRNRKLGRMKTEPCPVKTVARLPSASMDDRDAARDASAHAAVQGVVQYGLFEDGQGKDRLEPGTPITVNRVDQPDTTYDLVPLYRSGTYLGIALVDRLIGYAGAHSIVGEPPIRSTADVEHMLLGMTFDPPLGRHTRFQPGEFTVDQALVWRPSRESATPFQPFFRVVLKEGGEFYVRTLDDAIVPQISDPLLGG